MRNLLSLQRSFCNNSRMQLQFSSNNCIKSASLDLLAILLSRCTVQDAIGLLCYKGTQFIYQYPSAPFLKTYFLTSQPAACIAAWVYSIYLAFAFIEHHKVPVSQFLESVQVPLKKLFANMLSIYFIPSSMLPNLMRRIVFLFSSRCSSKSPGHRNRASACDS